MAFILNEDDIQHALGTIEWQNDHGPNLVVAITTLNKLVNWVNDNSDGWAYWSKPTAASKKLQQLVHDRLFGAWDARVAEDITTAELRAALTPIRSFLTRQGVDPAGVL